MRLVAISTTSSPCPLPQWARVSKDEGQGRGWAAGVTIFNAVCCNGLALQRFYPAGDVTMERGGCQAIPMGVLGQSIDVRAVLRPLEYQTEPMGYDNVPRPSCVGDFELNLLFACFCLNSDHLSVGQSKGLSV